MKRGGTLALVVAVTTAALAWAGIAGAGHDKTPPQTYISGAPAKRTSDRTPTFSFYSNEKKSRFVCKRDGKRFRPCSSPMTLGTLSYGRHGFYVRAIDPFANRDPTASAYTFKVVRP